MADEQIEKLVNEGQEYYKLRQEFKKAANPSAGTAGYLISLKWVNSYKKYLHYRDVAKGETPQFEQGYEEKHPGLITNGKFLNTDEQIYLTGVVVEKPESGKEAECLDRFIDSNATEYNDYEICNKEMWDFVSSRYGFDFEVRRYYKKQSWSYYTSVEVEMKRVPIFFCFCENFAETEINNTNYKKRYIQVPKSATYSDLKKRAASCVS